MRNYFHEIVTNQIFLPVIFAWLSSQALKLILTLITKRKLDLVRLVGSGGMPSAHSATIMCVTVSVGLYAGFDSIVFALSAVIASVVMYDAAGVRMAAGRQARLLNELVENFFAEHYINQKKLKELLGHTPLEVFAGAIWGTAIAIAFYRFF